MAAAAVHPRPSQGGRRPPLALPLLGGVLILWSAWIVRLSPRLHYSHAPVAMRDILLFSALYVAAGFVYLAALWRIRKPRGHGRYVLLWIVLIGAVLRLMMFASAPILQNDFNRYLWDGAVTASGLNPYAHAPAEGADPEPDTPDRLRTIGVEGRRTLKHVNHARLKTIYPPVAQGVFALSYWIGPWSETAWRCVLLAFDAATLILLLALLRRLGRPLEWSILYWWCPVAIFETFNGLHMDALAGPFVLGAVLLAVRGRAIGILGSMAALALAVGVKLWPIVLAPPLLRYRGPLASHRPRASAAHEPSRSPAGPRILASAGLAVSTLLILIAMASGGLGEQSGTLAYAESWYNNSAFYLLQLKIWRPVVAFLGFADPAAHAAARCCAAAAMAAFLAWMTRRPAADAADLSRRAALVASAVFLLAPAQFPWYFLWPLPLIAVAPPAPMLLYAALIPLFYLEYDYPALAWIEHVPIWILIALDCRYSISERMFGPSTTPSTSTSGEA